MAETVYFCINDAYLPEPTDVLEALTPEAEIVGVVVGLSDGGMKQDAFATVEIDGKHRVIVPVNKLRHVGVDKLNRTEESDISP
jgi:hypothetical protein